MASIAAPSRSARFADQAAVLRLKAGWAEDWAVRSAPARAGWRLAWLWYLALPASVASRLAASVASRLAAHSAGSRFAQSRSAELPTLVCSAACFAPAGRA